MVVPDDLHITLIIGKKEVDGGGDELYLQGHVYLEKTLRGDGSNRDEYDHAFLSDASKRRDGKLCEEWHYTRGASPKSSDRAPPLALKPRTQNVNGLEEATANLKL